MAFGIVPALLLAPAAAAPADLYSATMIVTGRDNLAERARGIQAAFPLVLTKVRADAEVGDRAVAEGLSRQAEALVSRLDYVDRKEGIQISDEQGTRERSFELTVHFDPRRIDGIVTGLGGEPWMGPRPQVAVTLVVRDGVSEYLLTGASDRGYGQRLALRDGADALGMPIALPDTDGAAGSPVRLEGRMEMTPAGYWNTGWHLAAAGLDERFTFENTTFDAAISGALRRSAKALAKR